ncbi:DUF1178 family protein [Sphingomonas sp. MMS24-J45]|uniref:DUF1178 family protein n=1 Tax=Sphingomonas sp. MMS24-J45 TaxID=3238806 RepID=UPI00384D16E2
MIVFDLRCPQHHVFEAWFASSAAYEDQRARGLLACPMCGDSDIAKAVMAPNIPAKSNTRTVVVPAPTAADAPPTADALKAALNALANAQAEALKNSQWVGRAFAETARAMHDGEVPATPIHGQTTLAEAKALVDDGVPVAALPLPIVPPDAVN